MGTTLSHLQTKEGIQVAFVLLIEGMPYALTTSSDTAACATALAATPWSTVYAGLTVRGTRSQSIEPWQREFKASELIFLVQPVDSSSDVFGKDIHKTGGGSSTELRASIDCNDTTIPVMDHTNLTSPVWLGTERITYSGTSGTAAGGDAALTGCTRGTYSPFDDAGEGSAGDAHEFGRSHILAGFDYDVKYRPKLSTSPRVWIGRRVELRAFRIVGTTWDVYAESHRVFAGTIKNIQDVSEGGGATQVVCEDVFSVINETTLLHDQWRARVKEGAFLRTGAVFEAEEKLVTTASPPVNIANDANDLAVAAVDSFPNQIAEGYYTASDLIARLNDWLADEKNADGTIDHFWSFALTTTGDDVRVRWRVEATATAYVSQLYKFRAPKDVLSFLGFDFEQVDAVTGEIRMHTSGVSQIVSMTGTRPPLRTLAFQGYDNTQFGLTLELESSAGTWVDNTEWLPDPLPTLIDNSLGATGWGLIQIGNSVVVGRRVSDLEFEGVFWSPSLKAELGDAGVPDMPGVSLADGGYLEAKQIVVLDGTLTDIVARLFASTGTAGYGHSVYDDLPAQLGCALPWDLLGDDFVASLSVLEQDSPTNAIRIVLEKPTLIAQCLLPELLLRGAFLVWKSGGLRFTQWSTPVGAIAIHSLTEANKGSSVPGDPQLSPTTITAANLRNVVKVEYNRRALIDGQYRDTYEFKFSGSISDYGVSKPFTVEARGSYAGNTATGDTVQELAAALIGKYVPMWGVPIQIMQRSINTTLLEDLAPGDIAIVTDDFIRDPATGERGITDKPALIISHECQWWEDGNLYGRVTLAFLALDNVPVYSPSAILTATTYAADTPSAGKSQIQAEDHNFTYTDEDEDWTHFSDNDEVTVYEIDDPGGSPQSWNVTAEDRTGNLFTFDANLTGIDASGATKYAVVSRKYASTTATQKSKAFQASALDLRIENERNAYEYGHAVDTMVTVSEASSTVPSLADVSGIAYADGAPVTPLIHRDLARLHENFVDYKSAPQMPVMVTGTPIRGHALTTWQMRWSMPYYAGVGYLVAGDSRSFSVAPLLDSTSAAVQVECRITLSMSPPRGSSLIGVTFSGPYRQLTFTHQSTTQAIKTPQEVLQTIQASTGWGYLTVELRATTGASSQVDFFGIAEFELEPRV